MKKALLCLALIPLFSLSSQAQVLLSGGLSYSQNFDSLPSTGTSGTWTDNSVITGWYASKIPGGVPGAYTVFRIDAGANNSGSLFDYGSASSSDRALGALSSGTPINNAIGLLFKNDTGSSATYNISISYTGEQWRQGGNLIAQTNLAFDYMISTVDIAGNIVSPVTNNPAFTGVAGLNFVSPSVGALASALDGNNALNRTALSAVLANITLNAGEELMLRWVDINDSGNDNAGAIDDLTVTFEAVPEPATAALGGLAALGLLIARRNRNRR